MAKLLTRRWNKAILLALALAVFAPSGHSAPLDPKTIEVLSSYGDRFSDGTLITPPRGNINSETRETRKYIEDIIERLAGDRLRNKDIRLVVNLYAANDINAFATKSVRARANVPLRRLLGKVRDGKTIYEIGIHTALLRGLKTESELAFILGHELSHIFEGHIASPRNGNQAARWWGSQRYEAIADHEALQMMSGKYDLKGGISALERLARLSPARDTSDFLETIESGLSSHHHEGVRISSAQAAVEELRRTRPEAALESSREIPTFARSLKGGRSRVFDRNFTEFKAIYRALADDLLAPGFPGWYKAGENATDGTRKNYRRFLKHNQMNRPPSPEQLSEVFINAIRRVDAMPGVSTQQKMDFFFKLSLFHQERYQDRFWNGLLSAKTSNGRTIASQNQIELRRFLQKYSSKDWNFQSFADLLASKAGGNTVYRDLKDFLLNGDVQALLQPLASNPAWKGPISQLPLISLEVQAIGTPMIDDLGILGRELAELDPKTNPLLETYQKEYLRYLKLQPMHTWSEKPSLSTGTAMEGFLRYLSSGDIEKMPGREFMDSTSRIVEPYAKEFLQKRQQILLGVLQDPKAQIRDVNHHFRTYFWESAQLAPPEKEVTALEKPVLDWFRRIDAQGELIERKSASAQAGVLISRFGRPELSKAEKKEIFQIISSVMSLDNPGFFRRFVSEERSRVLSKQAREYLNSLSREEILALLQEEYRPFQTAISNTISTLHGEKDPKTDRESLQKLAEIYRKKLKGVAPDLARIEAWTRFEQILIQEQSRKLSLLTFIGEDRQFSEQFARKLGWDDLKLIIDTVQDMKTKGELLQAISGIEAWPSGMLNRDAGIFLLDQLTFHQERAANLDDWYRNFSAIMEESPEAIETRGAFKERIEAFLLKRFEKLPPEEVLTWLQKKHLLKALKADTLSSLATRVVKAKPGVAPAELAGRVSQVTKSLALETEYPDAYRLFQAELSEKAALQPHEIKIVFPGNDKSLTRLSEEFSTEIRGLSALVAETRAQPPETQLHMIEYLMGRREDMPAFILRRAEELDFAYPLGDLVRNGRARLSREGVAARVLVSNAFLAGPHSFIEKKEGLDFLLDHLLANVAPRNKEIALELSAALLEAQGETRSLALSYVLGQKSATAGQALTEAEILKSLLEANGVPTIKLGQYLAFTSELGAFKEALEGLQDSAMPISYHEAVQLVQKRFAGKWPKDLKILGVKGSGSVNIAIEYFDPIKKENAILSLSRAEIETATANDFKRFRRVIASLTKTPQGKARYGFLEGLSEIIEESVRLEFDKEAAYAMQKQVEPLYSQKVNGWQVRTVSPYDASNRSMHLKMQMAPGTSATKVLNQDPVTYREAMNALSQVEFNALLGIDQSGRATPVPLHANPDVHDGQVLIDKKNRTVTLIDFGQAVNISNEERDLGLDLLHVATGTESPEASLKILNQSLLARGKTESLLTLSEMKEILSGTDRMDIFVKLIAKLNSKQHQVPIASVHWVLGMNRQYALAAKTGAPVHSQIRNLILVRKAGGSLATYNTGHRFIESTRESIRSRASCLMEMLKILPTGKF